MPYLKIAISIAIVTAAIWAMTKEPPSTNIRPVHVVCETTKGRMELVIRPDWSPRGAERFLKMVDEDFFRDLPLFRCVSGFVCQFGPSPQRVDGKVFTYGTFPDDPWLPELRHFKPGYLSFAGTGANSRNFHIFIALGNVPSLGSQPWETPFGYVTDETYIPVVTRFYTGYGDMPPFGKGPDSAQFAVAGGEEYLKSNFPNLDRIQSCRRAY